jgi:endonuclease YncB( thermonuclease family)
MRPKKIASLMLLVLLLPAFAEASPDEAGGTVVKVADGKTFDIRIEKNDSRIREGVERVTLADLDLPGESIDEAMNELIGSANESTADETSAKELAVAILLNKTVWLDIDDKSEDGRNSEGELVSVLYLSGLDGQPVVSPSFNRMLVDYRIAELNDSELNEFDPADWWPPQENGSEENVSGEEAAGTKIGGLNVNVNPTKPKINVNPTKPVIDVNPTQPNATENETSENLSSNESSADAAILPFANSSEPVILRNLTVPITLINPRGSVTVINSTDEVTVIDPAQPVKVINSTYLEGAGKINETKSAANLTEPQRAEISEAEAAPEPGELTDPL